MTYAIAYFPEVAYDRTALNLFTEKVAPALQARDNSHRPPHCRFASPASRLTGRGGESAGSSSE